MHSSWQDFLVAQGAQIEAGVVSHFAAAPTLRDAADDTLLADLSHLAVIEVSGVDAQEFLNNQLTNDVHKLSPTQALYAGYCSPKGRLLANFLLWQRGDAIYLQFDAQLREAIQKRLSIYVLRSKVKLRNATEDFVCLGIAGTRAREVLATIFATLPTQDLACVRHGDIDIVQRDQRRYQLVIPTAAAPELWSALAAHARPVGTDVWRWLEIGAGIPWITPPTQEQFVPQMVNLDRFGGLSYQKGCYPGQEIVARMHYLGKLKRRMYLAHVDGSAAPLAGDALFSAAFGEQSCGMVVNAAPAPGGGYDLLASVQLEVVDKSIQLGSIGGKDLSILRLPYTLG